MFHRICETFGPARVSMACMKTSHVLTALILASTAAFLHASESRRTAEYILANSAEYEGKEVTLDVALVQPVHWKSPIAELAFFHAITIDRREDRAGGQILVAIPAADSGKFSKKYGMNFEGRNHSEMLKGTLLAAPGRGPGNVGHPRVWFLDTTGTAAELIKAKKLELADEGPGEKMGPGGPFGGRRGGAGLQ